MSGGVCLLLLCDPRGVYCTQKPSLSHELVEETSPPNQLGWCIELLHHTLVEDNDAVAVDYSVNAMGNCPCC